MRLHHVAFASLLIWSLLPRAAAADAPSLDSESGIDARSVTSVLEHPGASRIASVRAHYWVKQTIGTQYIAVVYLTNMTAAPLEGWVMDFELDPPALGIRNASSTITGKTHVVRGTGTTYRIEPGGVTWFEIDGTFTGTDVPRPSACNFGGEFCTFEDPPPTETSADSLGVDIAFWIARKDLTTYRGQVLLQNVTDHDLTDWTLRFSTRSLITKMDHVEWSRNADFYEVRGKGWTNRIRPDEVVWFSFDGVHGGEVDTLTACTFNGFTCAFVDPLDLIPEEEEPDPGSLCAVPVDDGTAATGAPPEAIRVDFTFNALWATGYTATVQIQNAHKTEPVRNWRLEFDLPTYMTITRFWNGDLVRSGSKVVVSALPWNACLTPGQEVAIGFEGKHDGRAVKPTGCSIDGSSCTFGRFVSTGIEQDESGVPSVGFALGAAYPNPFVGRSSVPFMVTETQEVELTLWDIQGRKRAVLYRGTAIGQTDYEADVDGAQLPAGVYMLRLTGASGQSVSKPLLRVR